MAKRALVLAGGGSRGSYQIGVWRALRELGWEFDIVTGTSVGALNGALMVQNDYDVAVEMWQTISTSDVLSMDIDDKIDSVSDFNNKLALFVREMAKNGGADPGPLEKILQRYIDEERIRQSPIEFEIVTVECPSLSPCIINKESLPEGELVDYLMASAACFPAMKMRQIGDTRYIDGGYYDNMPINLAIQRGADEIIAVDLEAIGRQKRVNAPGVKIRYIRSKWDLGVFILFDKEAAKRNIELGYLDMMKAFGKLEGFAYPFYRGEIEKNARRLEKYFDLITIKLDLTVQKYKKTLIQADSGIGLARVVNSTAHVRMTSDAAIAAAGETAARVFELSPLVTYTFDELNKQIGQALEQIQNEDLVQIAESLHKVMSPKEILRTIKCIDKRHVAAFCLGEIRKAYQQDGANALLQVLRTLVADEFIAGLYLFALELAQR
ncbi:NTE family protein [Hydrogenoanaerobacterium saccharovorans]|uniref:NTE family protein n=1 Tax=Hydrogenoanaerobacterium saccharovorans TaxID=474960 RepID=A0A1H8B150_9FIRM|nr:patatin-like phospholipase family protein [Hydrogenoanaerobacterium saccharovorans]RPF47640.1 NTE family protein [Hydrogenoanaerobacterium saccharovorans]SEM76691.1 NTE family protein [Hydrogenoanaerobacterium saccharovorans]